MAQHNALPPSERVAKKPPRMGKYMVQEYYCICYQLQCECSCAVGTFKDCDREDLPTWYDDWKAGENSEPRCGVCDNIGSFTNELFRTCFDVSYLPCRHFVFD